MNDQATPPVPENPYAAHPSPPQQSPTPNPYAAAATPSAPAVASPPQKAPVSPGMKAGVAVAAVALLGAAAFAWNAFGNRADNQTPAQTEIPAPSSDAPAEPTEPSEPPPAEPAADSTTAFSQLYAGFTSSSVYPEEYSTRTNEMLYYFPELAFDGKHQTAWAAGKEGNDIGEWLQVDFSRPTQVSGFYIKNGYWRMADLVPSNDRAKRIEVSFSDGTSEVFDLGDTALTSFASLTSSRGEEVRFAQPHATSWIRVTALDVYPGDQARDLCISEIELLH